MTLERPGELQPLEGEWLDSGDIVSVDREGFISIRGRAKRFAKIAGEMISLGAVEMMVKALWPEDNHAAVSVPDKRRGERIVLVTTCDEADPESLRPLRQAGRCGRDHGARRHRQGEGNPPSSAPARPTMCRRGAWRWKASGWGWRPRPFHLPGRATNNRHERYRTGAGARAGSPAVRCGCEPAAIREVRMLSINKVRHNHATANGVDIHYRSAGSPDAPALVLLHGVPSSSHMYRHVISPLAEIAHVIAPDMPAFGFLGGAQAGRLRLHVREHFPDARRAPRRSRRSFLLPLHARLGRGGRLPSRDAGAGPHPRARSCRTQARMTRGSGLNGTRPKPTGPIHRKRTGRACRTG